MNDASPPVRVVFLGDSITAGGPWQRLMPGIEAFNQGIGGDTTDGVLARLPAVFAAAPEVVVLLIGTNDFGNEDASVAHVTANIEHIRSQLHAGLSAVRVVLVSVLPRQAQFADRIVAANRRLRAVAVGRDDAYADMWPALADGQVLASSYTNDGLHLNEAGYLAYTAALRPILGEFRRRP